MYSVDCQDLKVKRLVRMRIQTLADVSDPAINTKLLQQVKLTSLYSPLLL